MNKVPSFLASVFVTLLGMVLLGACSSEKDSALNKAYHNTTSYYNAYYIGAQHIKDIEASIHSSLNPDYDKILWVYPPLDSSMATTYAAQLEDCIKKASLVIQYHKISKWVDDSYNLIGQARMYGYDFPNAITTFKYVNTKGEDPEARHWAIVNLMRTFIETRDMANAEAASDFLEQEILDKNNLKHLYLSRAYYYQVMDDKNNMVRNLVLATPLLSRPERARIYFIIGQVYQEIGFQSAAYEYYKKTIGSHPEYELSFYAKLNIASVTELNDESDLKAVRKYFKKLVKDEKNVEFRDRIYYENARFELRQGNLSEALKDFNLSIQSSVSNPKQKGLSYLRLGEIYYDTLKDFSIAQAYYDSAVTSLPSTYEDYEAIKTRSEVLDDFVEQISIITVQDSLLALATTDSTELMNLFIERAKNEADARKVQEARDAKRVNTPTTVFGRPEPGGIGNSTWYFDNVSAVSAGRNSFRQIWGDRPLEDHWRRSLKSSSEINVANDPEIEVLQPEADPANDISEEQQLEAAARMMYSAVPRSQEAIDASTAKVEQAYYRLGNIYYFDLNEKDNAITTFNTFLKRFPDSENKPEVLYQLYLIYMDNDPTLAETPKNELLEDYSNSIYTKLILNPAFEEQSNMDNEKLIGIYEMAYGIYEMDSLDSAYMILEQAIYAYPDLVFTSNLRLLQILIIGKTEPISAYQLALKKFIEDNPDHELRSYAMELLEASDTYRSSLVKLKDAEFEVDSADMHFYVVTTTGQDMEANKARLQEYIDNNTDDNNLVVGSLLLDDTQELIIVRSFKNEEEVLLFYDTLKALFLFDEAKNYSFVITSTNFDELYRAKELDNYLKFYKDNY